MLMISKVRYRSFKDVDLRQRRPYTLIALLAIGFALIANAPQTVMLSLAALYVASGPAERLWMQGRRRQHKVAGSEARADESFELNRTANAGEEDR